MLLSIFLIVLAGVSGLGITGRQTADANLDGSIDKIELTFDGSISTIQAALDNEVQAGAFVVQGYRTTGFTGTSGTQGYIALTPLAVSDTGAAPWTKYTAPAGSTTGIASDSSWQQAADHASPVLLSVNVNPDVGDESVSLLFSEPVFSTNGGTGALTHTEVTYSHTGCSAAPTAVDGDYDTDGSDKILMFTTSDGNWDGGSVGCATITMTSCFDAAGLTLASSAITISTNPGNTNAVVFTEFVDQDHNGHLDGIRLRSQRPWWDSTFNPAANIEALVVTTPDRGDVFLTTGFGQSAVVVNDNYMFLNFSESAAYDTGGPLSMRFGSSPTGVQDWTGRGPTPASLRTSGKWADAPTSNTVLTDKAQPILYDAATMDMDGDGQIDRIRLSFSENMVDSTTTANQWTITNPTYTVTSISTGTANDGVLDLVVTPKTVPDTGATPTITYSSTGSFADPSGNILYTRSIVARDAIAPKILTATGTALQTSLVIVFSEGVYSTAGGNLAASAFTYVPGSNGGASSIQAPLAQPDGSGGSVTATVNALFATSDFGVDGDGIAAVSNAIKDSAGNFCGTTTVQLIGISGAVAGAMMNVWLCLAMIFVAYFAM